MSEIFRAYLENEASIRRVLSRFTKHPQQIDDFAQETFMRAFAAELKQEIRDPKAFLFQVAKNVALSHLRKNRRNPTDWLEDSGGSDLLIDENQISGEDWYNGRQKLALLAMAVAQLPPKCRKAFLLRRIDGLPYKQIASRMNISVSAVEKHVAAGLLKCSVFMREKGYDPEDYGASENRPSAPTNDKMKQTYHE